MHPGVAPIWSNPSYIAQSRLRGLVRQCLGEVDFGMRKNWLDIGCGTRPYEAMFSAGTYLGTDVPASGRPDALKLPDVFYDGGRLPFRAACFDGVFSTQVLEHVSDPEAFLAECRRVLKPGGMLLLSAPFVWQEHEQPYDYFRFSSFGLRALLGRCGFEIGPLIKSGGAVEALAQAMSTYASTNFRLPVRGFGRLVTLLVCCPLQLAGLLLQRVLPDHGSLFLDCVVIATKARDAHA